jgi:hypothetical protein
MRARRSEIQRMSASVPVHEVRLAPGTAVMKPDAAAAHGLDEALALEIIEVAFRTGEDLSAHAGSTQNRRATRIWSECIMRA